MSLERESEVMSCASCGIAGVDEVKLKDCYHCDLVRYCSDACQELHRPEHAGKCRKRAAELRDEILFKYPEEILFKQPESTHLGDCPLCCLPVSVYLSKSVLYPCCSKYICNVCDYANRKREYEGRLERKCPFCRAAVPKTDEEEIELVVKRIEANDPIATCGMGIKRYSEGNFEVAVEYWTRAAALGDVEAHYRLSMMYDEGKGVEKDEIKELHHLTEAAIGGHPDARHNLGLMEETNGRVDRAAKHYIIAAKLGVGESLKSVKELYKDGHVNKDDFATALRGHHAAIKATESDQRKEAVAITEWLAERRSGAF